MMYAELIKLMRRDESLNHLRPIKDMRPFMRLNNALHVWDKNNTEWIVKYIGYTGTGINFVSWKAKGKEKYGNY